MNEVCILLFNGIESYSKFQHCIATNIKRIMQKSPADADNNNSSAYMIHPIHPLSIFYIPRSISVNLLAFYQQ